MVSNVYCVNSDWARINPYKTFPMEHRLKIQEMAGGQKTQKHDYVIHGWSLAKNQTFPRNQNKHLEKSYWQKDLMAFSMMYLTPLYLCVCMYSWISSYRTAMV